MEKVHVYVTSAFCKDGSGGNKAGVVFERPDLTNEEKMYIAEVLGYSETAFVTASEKANYKLEYFTPTEEVPLCGHATIATFATMYALGMLGAEKRMDAVCGEERPSAVGETVRKTIETKAGILEISVSEDGLVMMQQNAPEYYEVLPREELVTRLGDGVSKNMPIQIVSTGLKDIIAPFESVEALHAAVPDSEAITALSRKYGVVGIHAFAVPDEKSAGSVPGVDGQASDDAAVDAVCRNFAPLYGIDEESATGTASCALTGYLFKNGLKKNKHVFEQGYSMNLLSRIRVEIMQNEEKIERIFVGGYGKVVEEKDV